MGSSSGGRLPGRPIVLETSWRMVLMRFLRGMCDSMLEYQGGTSDWSWKVVGEACFATTAPTVNHGLRYLWRTMVQDTEPVSGSEGLGFRTAEIWNT